MITTEAHNQPIGEVYEVLTKLLIGAKESVWQSTALSTDGLLKIRPVVERSAKQVKTYRIIIDGVDAGKKALGPEYSWLRESKRFDIRVATGPNPLGHWIIVDGKNMRLERPHKRPEGGAEVPRDNLLVIDCSPDLAREAQDVFNGWWARSAPFLTWAEGQRAQQ